MSRISPALGVIPLARLAMRTSQSQRRGKGRRNATFDHHVGFNESIELIAAVTGVEVADMYGQLSAEDWVGGEDCRHPDMSGYHQMADVFLSVLS